ncbi:luciferase family protein [Streptomyces sp. NPDC102395]|uniref:luciferase domain-containing protein n=1 Tax=Streptomyces sp. NPDC102395 TaxID=3366168 RepID=UPI0037F7FF0F
MRSATAEIAHFHSGRHADLHLSARLIQHFGCYLSRSSAIRLAPGSHWATISLERDWDIDLLMTLVSVALQALQGRPDLDDAPPQPCNDHFGVMLAPEHAGDG